MYFAHFSRQKNIFKKCVGNAENALIRSEFLNVNGRKKHFVVLMIGCFYDKNLAFSFYEECTDRNFLSKTPGERIFTHITTLRAIARVQQLR